ncbi:phosphatidylinositol-3-phosphate-binding ubiquitin-protein ligase [Sugiyamaella lignohabitans]|uniref:RING-type E3 ubiquitin transferase n=1 Tax=Sugiyamaella lignohabitans TaxID=796027 RepID=A0A167FSW6_9ASCO|nr:phosphatidylinositol-3-phosphate-binding ubiquitin-protein ligase [Sugiyamaella lignohabitans]ANB15663.1 phosphatidylinositol-3-phosphate-binding ubiquitin-protein ligase [Sugiyamaella lignohabitans]
MAATYVVSPPSQIFLESPHVPHRTCDECMEELEMIRAALRARPSSSGSSRSRRRSSAFRVQDNNSSNTPDQHRRRSNALSGTELPHRTGTSSSSSQQSPKGYDDSLIQTISIDYNVDDENACPICGRSLAKCSEEEKESHIADCVRKAEFSGEHQRRSNRMLIYQIPKEMANSPSPADEAGTIFGTSPSSTSSNHGECVICFEDFVPGDTVGRLECLCIYHEKCILDWFKRKGAGSCPVHAVHT